jgi:hypothetical protein
MSRIKKIEAIDHAVIVAEFATLLHLGKTAIYEVVRRNAIPCHRLAPLRFNPQEIADSLRSRLIPKVRRPGREQ